MCLVGMIHMNSRRRVRWDKSQDKDEASVAVHSPPFVLFSWSHIVVEQLLYHSISITCCPSWLRCSFETFWHEEQMVWRDRGYIWLIKCVCVSDWETERALLWWMADSRTVSPLWPPPAGCPVMSPDIAVALPKTQLQNLSITTCRLSHAFYTIPPTAFYTNYFNVFLCWHVPPTKHFHDLSPSPLSIAFVSFPTPTSRPSALLLRWMQGRHGVSGTAIWPCDEWR